MSRKLTGLTLMVLALAVPVHAELKLPAIFSDHMVLQRDLPVPVWGWAEPGEEVSVSIAGQSVSAKAGTDGKWKLSLKPLTATDSAEMVVKGRTKTLSVRDVAIGEVWLASGQSNMVTGVGRKEDLEKVLPYAADPSLRVCSLAGNGSYVLQEDAPAKWIVSSRDQKINNLSAVGYTFASHLRRALKVPVGIITAAVGGVSGVMYLSPEAMAASSDPGLKACAERYQKERAIFLHWKNEIEPVEMPKYLEAKEQAKKNNAPEPKMPRAAIGGPGYSKPSMLYHGQLGPVIPYAIRGALWYQGENSEGPTDYRALLDALVADWRKQWNNPDLPLLVVQITAQKPEFREKQLQFWQATPNTGLAVINDTCTADEKLHVRYKETAGRRLSLIARAITYGEKIEYSGPVYQSVKFDGSKAVVSFTHLGDGLAAKVPVDPTTKVLSEADLGGDLTAKGGELKGFTLAGEDQKFVPAKAEIVGDTVVVSSDHVAQPVAVRYLWCEWPQLWTDTTLYNKSGLPAPPFRSDSWIR
jgi:sialate O-acetylesterase